MGLLSISDYLFGYYNSSSFGVTDGYGKGGAVTRTTYLTSQKVDCWLDSGDFLSWMSPYSIWLIDKRAALQWNTK